MKLTARTQIKSPLERILRLTQMPEQHARWDLRFTEITYFPKNDPDSPQRFRYATRIGGGIQIEGWGETVFEKTGRASSLRFGSEDPKSLIRHGQGCWIYEPNGQSIGFSTTYDYEVRYGWFGKLVDLALFRPLMIWATRWSFDRLRLWLEQGLAPEITFRLWLLKLTARMALGAVWILEGLLPKILLIAPEEVELVRRSGLFWFDPEVTLHSLGLAQIMGGLLLIIGWRERLAATVATLGMLLLSGLVLLFDPLALADPYGGLLKHFCLLACAVVLWVLAPITPQASRASARHSSK